MSDAATDDSLEPTSWPMEQIAAATDLVLPGLPRVKTTSSNSRYALYRHIPLTERERIVWHAEEFARDIDKALRLMEFWPPDVDHLHVLLGVALDMTDFKRDHEVVRVRDIGGTPVVTLKSYCGIGTPRCAAPECLKG